MCQKREIYDAFSLHTTFEYDWQIGTPSNPCAMLFEMYDLFIGHQFIVCNAKLAVYSCSKSPGPGRKTTGLESTILENIMHTCFS